MTIKQLKNIIEEGESLKLVAEAFTEISSTRLKQIRNLVEQNRFFLSELSRVYQVVKETASKERILPVKAKKSISLVITSNYHFYGEVNTKLIEYFVELMKSNPTDQLVIGKTGEEYLSGINYSIPYKTLIFDKDYPGDLEFSKLLDILKEYTKITVFYAELKSAVVQIPVAKDITQTSFLEIRVKENQQKKSVSYKEQLVVFEPEMDKILGFFENQVINLLLQQSFLESELSRTAARLIAMDNAQSNANDYIHSQRQLLSKAKRVVINEKLLETHAALMSLNAHF